jgi:hypothetical protein
MQGGLLDWVPPGPQLLPAAGLEEFLFFDGGGG